MAGNSWKHKLFGKYNVWPTKDISHVHYYVHVELFNRARQELFLYFKQFVKNESKKIGETCAWRGWNILSVKCWQDVMPLKALHIHLYSKKKIERIKKTWFQMTSEWLVKYRKIDIWVEAHVGSSSCTSTRTSVILNNTGTSSSSHFTKPHIAFLFLHKVTKTTVMAVLVLLQC